MNDGGGGGNLMMADQNDTSRYALILSLHASDELHKKKLARSNDENMVRKWSECHHHTVLVQTYYVTVSVGDFNFISHRNLNSCKLNTLIEGCHP
jgi:hypothetical protein